MQILGVSAYYHDSAACLIRDGEIIAAAQEERFTRIRHDSEFPVNAIRFCLDKAGTSLEAVDAVVFYEKPFIKFERLLKTYISFAPWGLKSFCRSMPLWIKDKLFMKAGMANLLEEEFGTRPKKLLFSSHHRSHAASAFFASAFDQAAVLCLDGVGEWATTSAWLGDKNSLTPLWEIRFPHSVGLLYSAFTLYIGFKVNSGEYKLMGLAPYGKPVYKQKILENLMDMKPDGTFRLNMQYFGYCNGLSMINQKFCDLFGGPAHEYGKAPTQRQMDLARSVQEVVEEIILRLAKTLHKETAKKHLCLAGGVALNCVANGRVLRESPYESIWIQPAAGDAGGALGAALGAWHEHFENPRNNKSKDLMQGCYLGPDFSEAEIQQFLDEYAIPYKKLSDQSLFECLAKDIEDEKVIGWFNGRMEYGPRALGARSIIGDARSAHMQSLMNLKIKFRESFRPFAPSVLRERLEDYFDLSADSPYMLLTAQVKKELMRKPMEKEKHLAGLELLGSNRSDIPAVTHVDGSARVQSVDKKTNPRFHALLKEFEKRTGCGTVVNTSFNVRGEPIVCTPIDAYKCFMRTKMDVLALENFYLRKEGQPEEPIKKLGLKNFAPD